MTCPGQSHFHTQLSCGHSPLLAALVLAQAKIRECNLEQERPGQGE